MMTTPPANKLLRLLEGEAVDVEVFTELLYLGGREGEGGREGGRDCI